MTELETTRIYARKLETKLSEFLRQVLELEVRVQLLEDENRNIKEAAVKDAKLNTPEVATPS